MAVKSINIYSTHTCPFCKMTKHYLDEQGLKYGEIFVDDDEAKKSEMVNLSGQMGTPVVLVEYDDGEKRQFVGYDEAKLVQLTKGEKSGEALIQEMKP
ncbi:MAG: glutaredoxin family protein [Patescibacteria group bacterium]